MQDDRPTKLIKVVLSKMESHSKFSLFQRRCFIEMRNYILEMRNYINNSALTIGLFYAHSIQYGYRFSLN